MQRKLSRWATEDKERKFKDLYSLLCNEIWLRVAHKSVSANAGRETAGIDGMTMSHFTGNLARHLEELKNDLKARIFAPLPVDRAYVPKSGGKLRPLGIPGMKDRIVQEALRMILEPIWEADFSIHAYGFRPNRSTYDAIATLGVSDCVKMWEKWQRENVGYAGVGRASPARPRRCRRRLMERRLPVDLIFHAETLAFDDDGLGVMQQPIQDRRRQGTVIVEDLRPFLEGAV